MTDPNSPLHEGNDHAATGHGNAGGLARWQKVLGLIGLVVVVVLVILLFAGDHGPGRHISSGGQEQPADVESGAGHDPSRWSH